MKERRKESRRKEENRITIAPRYPDLLPYEEKTVVAFTQDISAGGVRIITDIDFPADTELKIKIVLSQTGEVIDLDGEVRWVNKIPGEDMFEMGIEFVGVDLIKSMLLLKHIYGRGISDP